MRFVRSSSCGGGIDLPRRPITGDENVRKIMLLIIIVFLAPGLFAQAGGIQTTSITLTPAQITSLRAMPVSLIAAPGPGKAISPVSLVAQYKFGTVPYSVSS